jgi:hypothetical protein
MRINAYIHMVVGPWPSTIAPLIVRPLRSERPPFSNWRDARIFTYMEVVIYPSRHGFLIISNSLLSANS